MSFLSKKVSGPAAALQGLAVAVLAATPIVFGSCSSEPKVEKTSTVAYREGVPGGTLVERYQITATVSAIDAGSRKVTLTAPDESRNTFTAAPTDRTFDQLRVGDPVRATVTRQLVIFLRRDGAPLSNGPAIAADLAPDAANSDVLKSDTVQRTATVAAVDPKRRRATLRFADGTSRSFPVRKDVELQGVKLGEEVVIRTTSAVVLTVEKP